MDFDPVVSLSSRVPGAPLPGPLASDERLAKLVGQGDHAAFELLYKRYQRPLHRYCLWLLRNETDAEDALQSAFVSALQALRREHRDAPVRPWLFRIAHNESISTVRRRRSEAELTGFDAQTASLEDRVEERENLALLVADLRDLPDRQRAALLMRELSGLSHKEIALALGASVDAAKQSIYEARGSLQAFTEGRAMGCDQVQRLISDADGRMLRGRRVRAHIRHCPRCAAFAAAIGDRSRQLRALAPGVPPTAAAGLLAHWLGGSPGAGDASVAGLGKTAVVGVGVAMKAGALTTLTAVLGFGTSVELPRMLAHHHVAPSIRKARGADGPAPSLGHRSASGDDVAASASVAATFETGVPRPVATVRRDNGRVKIGDALTSGHAVSVTRDGGHGDKTPSPASRRQTGAGGTNQGGNSQSNGDSADSQATGSSSTGSQVDEGSNSNGQEQDGGSTTSQGESQQAGSGSSGDTSEGQDSGGQDGGGTLPAQTAQPTVAGATTPGPPPATSCAGAGSPCAGSAANSNDQGQSEGG